MNYTVDWEADAEVELASIWLRAPDPAALTRAQAEIDRLLSRNPDGHGQHLSEGLWRIHVSPLEGWLAGRSVLELAIPASSFTSEVGV